MCRFCKIIKEKKAQGAERRKVHVHKQGQGMATLFDWEACIFDAGQETSSSCPMLASSLHKI